MPSQPPQVWLLMFKVSSDTVQPCKLGSGCWEELREVLSGPPPICSKIYLSSGWWLVLLFKLCCGMPVPSQAPCWIGFTFHLPSHYRLAWRPANPGAQLALDPLCSSLDNVGLRPCLPRCPLWLLAHLPVHSSLLLLLLDKYSPMLWSHLTYNILITYVLFFSFLNVWCYCVIVIITI